MLQLLGLLHFVVAGAFVLDLLRQHRSSGATIAWIAILLLLPYLGLALYVLAGAPRKRTAALVDYLASHVHLPLAESSPRCPDTERLLRALGLPGATDGNRVKYCSRNEDAATELLALIRGARERLLLSVFSFEADDIGRQLIDAMAERARAGVAVRMLLDSYGSKELPAASLRALVAAGGRVARHRRLFEGGTLRGAFNYRNHRKIVVADGRIAWVGGRNIARKYLSSSADGSHWVDLTLVVEGAVAAVLESVFRSDWLTASGETLRESGRAELQCDGASTLQVLASGPDLPDDTLHAMLLAGILGAQQRIWIVSPYFAPDDAIQSVLRLACRRGVDVRIIVPRRSNMWLADRVRGSYLTELAALGAAVRLYVPTVVHAKLLVLDQRVALVGSANFDMRSLFTNHEVAVVMYSAADVAAVADVIANLEAESVALEPGAPFAATALSGAMRIIAPLV